MERTRFLTLVAVLVLFLSQASSKTTFGEGGDEPLPNVTKISIYDVTGRSTSQKEIGGDLEVSGINQTLSINQSENERQYRFSFKIKNSGSADWTIEQSDNLLHQNLDSSWSLEKTWYNISSDYDGGGLVSNDVEWDTSKGGTLSSGDYMYAKYLVNISLSSSSSYSQKFVVNDSSTSSGSYDEHILDVNKVGYLNVTLSEPPDDTVVTKNEAFRINASVVCENGECGKVEVTPRYNDSGDPDTVIPRDSGKPFYVNSSRQKVCDKDLGKSEKCFTSWYVNSTGSIESYHLLDANATSSYSEVSENDSEDSLVQINTALIIDVGWNSVEFGVLDPGSSNNSAEGNKDLSYNLTVDEASERVDKLWIKATNLTSKTTSYTIAAKKLSYSLQNDITTENFLSESYQIVKQNISPGSILNFFFWLDVPEGKAEGGYNGTLVLKANSTG